MERTGRTGMLFIFLTILFTVLGQLLLKGGMQRVGALPSQLSLWTEFLLRAFTNGKVVLGLACAVVAAVCWIVAVSLSELSFAYPFMGLAIVLVLALSSLFFGEKVSLVRWAGVLIVCIGLWIAARK